MNKESGLEDGVERRFVGRNAREAYGKVRQELGRNAVIIDQRTGSGFVEVIASLEFPADQVDAHVCSAFASRLSALGYEEDFIDGLPGSITSWDELAEFIPNMIRHAVDSEPLTGTYRFIGAPGAGKTTSIIKLVAEEVFRSSASECLLIGTDSQRLAGCEPLALTADLLGLEYLEIDECDLEHTLASVRHKRLVLIDSAGLCSGQQVPKACGAKEILVIPASWQANALRRLKSQFSDKFFSGVALTHVDQAETLGAGFSVLAQWGIPLVWVSRGAGLPDDIERADMALTRTLMLQGIDRSQMNATFA